MNNVRASVSVGLTLVSPESQKQIDAIEQPMAEWLTASGITGRPIWESRKSAIELSIVGACSNPVASWSEAEFNSLNTDDLLSQVMKKIAKNF